MIIHACYRLLLLGLPVMIILAIFTASASTSAVSMSSLGRSQRSVDADDLKPSACSAQHIERLITGTGVISGTGDNDLILGGPGVDVISGEGGDDCIVGGGGADTLLGSSGDDACIGGPGIDELSCERQEP